MSNALTWSALFSQGTLIDTDISQHRFQVRILPEDIGIPDSSALKDAIDPGHNKLISKEYLDPINQVIYKIKKTVDLNSLCFPLVEGARYIPLARRDEVLTQLREHKSEFNSCVEKLITDYEAAKEKQIPKIKEALRQYVSSKPLEEQETIIQNAMQRVISKYPTAEEVRRKFCVSWKAFSISAPVDQKTAEALEEETKDVRDVVHEMIASLREELVKKIDDVLKVAQSHENLPSTTQESVESVLTRLEGMNILGDSALNTAIRQMRSIVGSGNMTNISQELVGLRSELEDSAEEAKKAAEDKLTSMGKRSLDLE